MTCYYATRVNTRLLCSERTWPINTCPDSSSSLFCPSLQSESYVQTSGNDAIYLYFAWFLCPCVYPGPPPASLFRVKGVTRSNMAPASKPSCSGYAASGVIFLRSMCTCSDMCLQGQVGKDDYNCSGHKVPSLKSAAPLGYVLVPFYANGHELTLIHRRRTVFEYLTRAASSVDITRQRSRYRHETLHSHTSLRLARMSIALQDV
ncbi:hypothetical protein OF83DRAFT_719023 [Amylostereum chailletii]|nr:hypothetical protein OF83DRAFT_719023 [Amylostereum chailletii]